MNTPILMQSEEKRAPWNDRFDDDYDCEPDLLDRDD